MEFSPFNKIVKLCLQGMDMGEKGRSEEALDLFMQGWNEASNDFEKFLTAHYIARQQKTVSRQYYTDFNTIMANGLNAGGIEPHEMRGYGFIQQRSIEDFDGHT